MSDEHFRIAVREIEQHLGRALDSLRIYQIPVDKAVAHCLQAFELAFHTGSQAASSRTGFDYHMLDMKAALSILVPKLLERCPPATSGDIDTSIDESTLRLANEALKFCVQYASLEAPFTQYYHGYLVGSLEGRVLEFSYAPWVRAGRDRLNQSLHQHREDMTMSAAVATGKWPPFVQTRQPGTDISERLRGLDASSFPEAIPDEAYLCLRAIIEGTVPGPTIDKETICSTYTLDDARLFWLEFATLALASVAIHLSQELKMRGESGPLERRLVSSDLTTLASIIARHGQVGRQKAADILTDLVLDTAAEHPDLQIQPLIRMPHSNILMMAPTMVHTANWEVCLLRNWVQRYRSAYNSAVAQKKAKLADELGKEFQSKGFKVETRRTLRDQGRQQIGDVDVALFDEDEGLLAILEVKWVIEPDSPKEVFRAHAEIAEGIVQTIKNKARFEDDRSTFLRQVFPDRSVTADSVRETRWFVVGHGDIGGEKDIPDTVAVIDYGLALSILREQAQSSLGELLTRVVDLQEWRIDEAAKEAATVRSKLAGFMVSSPGYKFPRKPMVEEEQRRQEPGRNYRCFCGSGLKYKKCCHQLRNYLDDDCNML